jgi:hypothetical protein
LTDRLFKMTAFLSIFTAPEKEKEKEKEVGRKSK